MQAHDPLALYNSGFIPELITFLLTYFEVTGGERKPSVLLSELFSSWLCQKCTEQWAEEKTQPAPNHSVLMA